MVRSIDPRRETLRITQRPSTKVVKLFGTLVAVGKLLAKLRFRRLSARPQHPDSDVAAQAAFKGASLSW
jgi:hypothetical protein